MSFPVSLLNVNGPKISFTRLFFFQFPEYHSFFRQIPNQLTLQRQPVQVNIFWDLFRFDNFVIFLVTNGFYTLLYTSGPYIPPPSAPHVLLKSRHFVKTKYGITTYVLQYVNTFVYLHMLSSLLGIKFDPENQLMYSYNQVVSVLPNTTIIPFDPPLFFLICPWDERRVKKTIEFWQIFI